MGIVHIDFVIGCVIWLYFLGGVWMCVQSDRAKLRRQQKLMEKIRTLFADGFDENEQEKVVQQVLKNIQDDVIFVHAYECYMSAASNYTAQQLFAYNAVMQAVLSSKGKTVKTGDALRTNMLNVMEAGCRSVVDKAGSISVRTYEKNAAELRELVASVVSRN